VTTSRPFKISSVKLKRLRLFQTRAHEEITVQMTRRILATLFLMPLLALSVPVAAEIKIAIVDVQGAILQSEEAKRLLQQIQNEFKDEEEEIVKIQSEAAAMLERLQKDAEVMSDAEKRRLQQQIESKNNDFVFFRQKLQRQVEDRQQELFAGVNGKVQKAIEELVKSEDYDLILPRQAALYVNPVYNITRKVTEKLNELDAAR
jgi:outer membrane protein